MKIDSNLYLQRRKYAWIFISPMIILMLLVAFYPLMKTFYFSFTDAQLSNMDSYELVGFDNYLSKIDGEWYGVLADPLWWLSIYNTLFFTIFSVSLETVLGMIFALALHQNFKGRGMVRACMLIPWAIPTVISSKMWAWLYNDQYGLINNILIKLHIISSTEPIAWIGMPNYAIWAVIFTDVWKTTPFMALMILSALQMLPSDCYEAAKVDGVHPIKLFFRVTLPLIKPVLLVAMIFRTMDSLRVFDLIYILTSNSDATISISGYAQQLLSANGDVGVGSSASMLVFIIIGIISVLYLKVGKLNLDK